MEADGSSTARVQRQPSKFASPRLLLHHESEAKGSDPLNPPLTTQFLPAYNRRFAVPASEAGTAFVPWIGPSLAEILCVQEERVVAKDNTVRYQGLSLQIPQDPHRFHYVRVTVRVHEYPDGTLAVFHGPRCLARYRAEGVLQEATVTTRPQPAQRRARQ